MPHCCNTRTSIRSLSTGWFGWWIKCNKIRGFTLLLHLHIAHTKSALLSLFFSPCADDKCFFNKLLLQNDLSHSVHCCLCFWWASRSSNFFLQKPHIPCLSKLPWSASFQAFSLCSVLIWHCRDLICLAMKPHWLHLCGLSGRWISSCFLVFFFDTLR